MPSRHTTLATKWRKQKVKLLGNMPMNNADNLTTRYSRKFFLDPHALNERPEY